MRKKKLWKRILALGLCITLTTGLPGEVYSAQNVSVDVVQDESENTEETKTEQLETENTQIDSSVQKTVENTQDLEKNEDSETDSDTTEIESKPVEAEEETTDTQEKESETEIIEEIETEATQKIEETEEVSENTEENNETETGETEKIDRSAGSDLTYGDFTYTVSGDNVTITGYTGNGGSVVVPEEIDGKTVTAIGKSTFSKSTNLISVIISENVKSIGTHCFEDCTGLAKVIFKDNSGSGFEVTINDDAFAGCSKLSDVCLSNNIVKIGSSVFRGCSELEGIVLPENLKTIGSYAFSGTGIKSITIPKSVTKAYGSDGWNYDVSPFVGAEQLTEIILEDGIQTIPDHMFDFSNNTSYFNRITIPESVTEIGYMSFKNCKSIKEITIPENVKSIGAYCFEDCTGLAKVIFKDNSGSGFEVTINDDAFADCTNMTIYGYPDSYAETYAKENNIPFVNYGLYTDDIASNAYGITENTRTKAGNVYYEIQCYNKSVNEYYGVVKDKFKTDYKDVCQKPGNFKELRKYDETAASRKTNQLLTIEEGAPTAAIDDAYEVLYDFLKRCMQTGVDKKLIKLDIDTSQSSVEIQAKIINKIYDAILDESGSIRGTGSNGYVVELRKTGIFGQAFGSVTISGGKKTYGRYTGVFCSDGKVVSAAMNQFVDDLSDEVRKLYKEAALSLWKDFMKKSELGSITEDMLKSYLGDKTDYLLQKGYGKLLTSMLNMKKGADLIKKISSAKTSTEALRQIQSADMEEIYKQITKLSYTDKELKDETVSQAMKKVESARKNLESTLFDYLYNEDTYSSMNAGQKFKYFWKSMFQCPVDVEVYDESGNLIGSVIDGVVSYDDSIYIEINGDVKTVYIPQDMKVTYQLTGTDDGMMNYVLEEYEDGAAAGRLNYYDVPLVRGVKYKQTVDEENISGTITDAPLIDADGKEICAGEYINAETDSAVVKIDVTVEDGGNVFGAGKYVKGDSAELTAVADSGYQFDGWYQNDILIDSHSNYIFTATEDQTLTAKFSKPLVQSEMFSVEMSETYQDNARIAIYDKSETTADIVISLYDAENTNDITVTAVSQDKSGGEVSNEKVTAVCDGAFHFSVNDYETDGWNVLRLYDEEKTLIGAIDKKDLDTEKPNDTETPGNTEKPNDTETPGNTEKPNDTEKPGNTEKPNDTEKPGNTGTPDNTKPTAIHLDVTNLTLKKGKKKVLKAQLEPSGVQNISLVWASSAPGIVTVDNKGQLTAKANGQAVITVKVQGKDAIRANCKVTVPYTITYKLNKGKNNSKNLNCYYNQKVKLKNPTRKGYRFKGWYTDKKFKNKVSVIKKGTKKNFTLYAKWEKVKAAKVNVISAKNNKAGQIQVKYKKVSGIKGYEITYSTDRKFKKSVVKKTTNRTSYIMKKLKKNKTYYIRIRAYCMDSVGKKVYGRYSTVKKVKIKK